MAATNLGAVHAKRDEDQAAYDYYDQSRPSAATSPAAEPDNAAYQQDLAVVLNRCANAAGALGDVETQRVLLEESLAIRVALLASAPGQNRQMRDVVTGAITTCRVGFSPRWIDRCGSKACIRVPSIDRAAGVAQSIGCPQRRAGSRYGHDFIATMNEYGRSLKSSLCFTNGSMIDCCRHGSRMIPRIKPPGVCCWRISRQECYCTNHWGRWTRSSGSVLRQSLSVSRRRLMMWPRSTRCAFASKVGAKARTLE